MHEITTKWVAEKLVLSNHKTCWWILSSCRSGRCLWIFSAHLFPTANRQLSTFRILLYVDFWLAEFWL